VRAAREESLPASKGRLRGDVLFFPNRYFDLWVALVGNLNQLRKRIFGGLKAYLRATDHTSSNIISRDSWAIDRIKTM
jgi:hypothetical protein